MKLVTADTREGSGRGADFGREVRERSNVVAVERDGVGEWLPVTCMPSPESPAKRITARSMTSRLVLGRGISVVVAISG